MVALQVSQVVPDEWRDPDPSPAVAPAPAVRSRPRSSRLSRAQRLRRRRLTFLVAASTLLLVLVAGVKAVVAQDEPSPRLEPISTVEGGVYVVQPGDTLWSIARRLSPDSDPRPVVQDLRSRHGAVELEVGDRLEVGDVGS